MKQAALLLGPEPKKKPSRKQKELCAEPWPDGLRSLTIDPNSLSLPKSEKTNPPRMGLCWRYGAQIMAAASFGFERKMERWTFRVWRPGEQGHEMVPYMSDWTGLRSAMRAIPGEDFFPIRALFYEVGMGANPLSVAQQNDCRGYVRALAHEAGCEWVMGLHSSTWKSVTARLYGVTKMDKAATLEVARSKLGLYLGDGETDASDAVLQSEAVPYMGVLPSQEEA